MNKHVYYASVLAAGIFTLTLGAGYAQAKGPEKKVKVSSLTIFPVRMLGTPQRPVAEALGLVLEKQGLRGIRIAESTFQPEKTASFEQISTQFGSFVAKTPPKTEFALYCEFVATPKRKVEQVRGVVVDRTGKVVWSDVQTPRDDAFKRMRPDSPMGCCGFLAARLRPILVLSPPSDEDGPMARLWAEKSGLPADREIKAMEKRLAAWKKSETRVPLVVFPVRTGKKVDRKGARQLADLLNERGLCDATVADAQPWFDIKANSNEMRILWNMARSFKGYVQENTLPAGYALYADYLMIPERGQVGAVHFAICDASGAWVVVDLQNSHQEEFQRISPKSIEDCNRLLVQRLENILE